jgi:hypothetical protein
VPVSLLDDDILNSETAMSRLLPPMLSPLPALSLPPPLLPRIHIRTSAVRGGAAENAAASGTTARERRLVKVREERRRREYDREHTYPGWAKYAACASFPSLFLSLAMYWLDAIVCLFRFSVVFVSAFYSCRNPNAWLLFLNAVIW